MLNIHILGHTYVTCRSVPIHLSAKAVALITYLALEQRPQHRERLADLLWTTSEARKNLRVELARIRAAGLEIFPRSSKILHLEGVHTDLAAWKTQPLPESQAELSRWLSVLRGFPLSGLEDLGDSALQGWLDQQRFTIHTQVEQTLHRAHAQYDLQRKIWATRLIMGRAEALGYDLVPDQAQKQGAGLQGTQNLVSQSTALGTDAVRLGAAVPQSSENERLFREALRAARSDRPQIITVYGPLGIGKSYLTERILAELDWQVLSAHSTRTSRLVLASLTQNLLRLTDDPASRETLRELLLRPGHIEEDMIKFSTVLGSLPGKIVLVLDHTQSAQVELSSLLEFLLRTPGDGPRALVLLSRQPPAQTPVCRSLARRFVPEQCTQIEVAPLSLSTVEEIIRSVNPALLNHRHHAAEFLQRSEGNALHLITQLEQLSELGSPPSQRWPAWVREKYGGEIDGWLPHLREALSVLSVINGDLNLNLAQAILGTEAAAVLREGIARAALIEQEDEHDPLLLPALRPLRGTAQPQATYRFRSEGLRVALASTIGHDQRQQVRRQLVQTIQDDQPGLALYYAECAGLDHLLPGLRTRYSARLSGDSPVPAMKAETGAVMSAARQLGKPRRLIAPPPRREGAPQASAVWQGYMVSWSENGWLNVVSQGRSGYPRTLTLQLDLPPESGLQSLPTWGPSLPRQLATPTGSGDFELRLIWRLDVFHPGLHLNPLEAPFALRVRRSGERTAHTFTPGVSQAYEENGTLNLGTPDVEIGVWMETYVHFKSQVAGNGLLDLSVRGLDVSLTIGAMDIGVAARSTISTL